MTDNGMDLRNSHVTEVEHAAAALTDGGNNSPYVFLRAGGAESNVEISPMMAYLYFIKHHIYRKNRLALTEQSLNTDILEDISLIVNTNLRSFFMSCTLISAWP